jgi:hypothetical protein
MHTVGWTIKVNEGTNKQDILRGLEGSAGDYKGVAGLIRTYLGLTADGKNVEMIFLWQSKPAADAYFTEDWETVLSRRWQAAPMQRQDWPTTIVVENK